MMQIVIAAISFLAAVATVSLSYFFTKKQQLKMETRKLKEAYYRSYIKALSDVAIDNFDDEAQKRFSEGFNSLIVIASPGVVKELMDYHDFIGPRNTAMARDSAEWSEEHDRRLRLLIKAMRQDIFGKEKNIDEYISRVHLVGKAPKDKIRIKKFPRSFVNLLGNDKVPGGHKATRFSLAVFQVMRALWK